MQQERREGQPGSRLEPTSNENQRKSRDKQGGSNNGISGLFIKDIQKIPERKGQRSLVEATEKNEWK